MSAKGLGILAMVYAIGELQNPLPLKAMLCKGDMNDSASRVMYFKKGKGFS